MSKKSRRVSSSKSNTNAVVENVAVKSKRARKIAVVENVAVKLNTSTHANGSAFSDARPGVVASIVEMLCEASVDRPITKSSMLEKLATRFNDRDAVKMKATLMMQVPSGLKIEKRLIVASVQTSEGRAYYIDREASSKCQSEYAAAKLAAKTK